MFWTAIFVAKDSVWVVTIFTLSNFGCEVAIVLVIRDTGHNQSLNHRVYTQTNLSQFHM